MKMALRTAPAAAAPGVAARSRQTTTPKSRLRTTVQRATDGICTAHQWVCKITLAAAKGSTTSKTSFDCQLSFFSTTLHRKRCVGAGNRLGLHSSARRFFHPLAASTEFSMQRFSAALAVFAGIVLTAGSALAQTPSQRLELDRTGQTVVLEPYAPNILRVTLSLNREPALAAPGYGIL